MRKPEEEVQNQMRRIRPISRKVARIVLLVVLECPRVKSELGSTNGEPPQRDSRVLRKVKVICERCKDEGHCRYSLRQLELKGYIINELKSLFSY